MGHLEPIQRFFGLHPPLAAAGETPTVPFWGKQNQAKALTHNEWDTGDGGKRAKRNRPSRPVLNSAKVLI